MNVDLELRDKSQKELEDDLTSAKHNLLEVRHQLNMAEKVRIRGHYFSIKTNHPWGVSYR